MSHIRLSTVDDVPVVVCERRRIPDRRTEWRGGRRDTDWRARPPGAIERLESWRAEASLWRRLALTLGAF